LSAGLATPTHSRAAVRSAFVDILRPPDFVTAFLEDGSATLTRDGGRWTGKGVAVEAEPRESRIPLRVSSARPLSRIRLRWKANVPANWRIVNDQWERSYGDLEWRGMLGERVLPWYFLASDGSSAHAYGVETGCSCFAFWQVDPAGISLWLDVRNGGSAVELGQRTLDAATVRIQQGRDGESAFQAAKRFCRALCAKPRLPREPVYGGNNWYYAYGENCSAGDIERDSDVLAELSPASKNRPFMVIDDGWSIARTAGPWERGNAQFPDMAGLASSMKRRGVRPGIWLRPLYTTAAVDNKLLLRPREQDGHSTLDPSIPEVAGMVKEDMRRMTGWGFELIKHDFSSFDVLARWGSAMRADLTKSGWHFADRSRTTAEIVFDLYRGIRESAGDAYIIGCNTFGHLAAGLVELQRTGDDTSGREFHRTRRMGVNTLAFRAPQHRAFFDLDADCAPITPDLPWKMAAQWLDLVARSGTALFVSADPKALNAESKAAMRRAFAAAAVARPVAEPLDWMDTTTPERWRIGNRPATYDWYGDEGGTPFPR
jgi:alpha-galactosidase